MSPYRHGRSRLPAALVVIGAVAGALTAGLSATRLLWPAPRIVPVGSALARAELAPFGERVAEAVLVNRSGRWLDASVHGGLVLPAEKLAAGSRIRVVVTIERARWLGWLLGSSERAQLNVVTPRARLGRRILAPALGMPVEVSFDVPVAGVSIKTGSSPPRLVRVSPPRRLVAITAPTRSAGSALVAGIPRLWERLPHPVRVSWFPPARTPELLVRPAPGKTIGPTVPLVLTFSRPLSSLLGRRRPLVWPSTAGSWREPDPHTLVFQPSGLGFPLGAHLRLGLTRAFRVEAGSDPASERTLSWHVAPGTSARLEEILGQLGYLPFTWRGSAGPLPRAASALVLAATVRPSGHLAWRFRVPTALRRLWLSPIERPLILRGALMAFQSAHGLTTSGVVSPTLWSLLLSDELRGTRAPFGYSYIFVTESLPETLTLWQDGRIILRTPVNTGIPEAPTALGTYPVYLHLASTTMSGTNPDGSHYSDPGVPWVNYFNGGDAVHGFVRPGYGYPQSLGCVEAPVDTAAQIWPYVHVGTLVTVAE